MGDFGAVERIRSTSFETNGECLFLYCCFVFASKQCLACIYSTRPMTDKLHVHRQIFPMSFGLQHSTLSSCSDTSSSNYGISQTKKRMADRKIA